MKRIIIWFGILGSIASILSMVLIFIPANELIKLEIIQTDKENLTNDYRQTEPNFRVIYKYKGTYVQNLWKYNFTFLNNSGKTLLGTGIQKNILTDYLTLKLKPRHELLDYKKLNSDFNHNLIIDSSTIKIAFEQWRPQERIEYSFYIRSAENDPATIPFEQLDFRQIVDGDIIFLDKIPEEKNERFLNIIPAQGTQVAYIISMIFLGLFILLFTFMILATPYAFYHVKKWRKKYLSDFIKFLENKFPGDVQKQNNYTQSPENLPSKFWKEFKGESYPNLTVDINISKFYSFILVMTLFILLNFSLLVTFIDLISFFP